ncbi:Phospholipase_D-nuclease N-terminal [Natrinema salaciae]|uniref:Phospholipase_D-nuclease N-terminal n=1 Tax=Natrinema salaciae TaxID=1186196 RepID=A0A1H9LVW2_9EURY|nr:Phospholipase_D-nuclease N-terminal [Natrinema salaciae]
MYLTLVAILGFVWLCVSIWVGFDATTNSSHDALLWSLTVVFGGIVGLLLYFNIGRDKADVATQTTTQVTDLVECPNCRAKEEANRDTCRFCNEPLHTS